MQNNCKILYLKKNEERRILAGHLWIFSNEIDTKKSPLKNFQPGELVNIISSFGKNLGIGYVNPQTLLCVRLLSNKPNEIIDTAFFKNKIIHAKALREKIFIKPFYRLIYGEGDFLPGLIIDRFNDVFVVQINTAGMENLKIFIIDALKEIFNPKEIIFKNDSSFRLLEGLTKYIEPVSTNNNFLENVSISENECDFIVPIIHGQKTGWFYDQQYNRKHLATYIQLKNAPKVLDVFCYIGAWGIQAAKLGAKEVFCLDASETALKFVEQNANLNKVGNIVKTIQGDAFKKLDELIQTDKNFDLIIIDPPAFIKRQKDLKAGSNAYLRLHELAIQLLKPSGILITTSCSLHLSRDMLLDTMRQAALNCKKELRVLEQLHQSPDHPLHLAISETNYLKGFIAINI